MSLEEKLKLYVSLKIEIVWGLTVLTELVVDCSQSVWHNACDNYQRLYPGKYEDYLQSLV